MSKFRSPTATDWGNVPVAKSIFGAKPPDPSPVSTDTVFASLLAVIRSARSSTLTSPIATDRGPLPVAKSTCRPKLPRPSPSATDTLSEPSLADTRSSRLSPFRSPTATDEETPPIANDLRSEASGPVAEQHQQARPWAIGHQVDEAVAVQVTGPDRGRVGARGEVDVRPEVAECVAEQHRHAARRAFHAHVGESQVREPIAVQVPDREQT